MSEPEIIARVEGRVGRLSLNRPKALNALTTQMCRDMIAALLSWRADRNVDLVLIDHTGERGFCAGGDIRVVAESGAGDGKIAREFFLTEYRLNHLLSTAAKPIVVLMDGFVMGGGAGIALPARYRVATARTVFAMPETGIGLFPDVGGGWFLPRMADHIGFWLALTGASINAADCLLLEIATHCVDSAAVGGLKAAIVKEPKRTEAILAAHHCDAGPAQLSPHRAEIASCFSRRSVDAIREALEAGSEWARAQADVMATRSPQAMKVAFRQLGNGRHAHSFAEELKMEYRIATRVATLPDFHEGVRAMIIDKDKAPRWSPSSLGGVTEQMLDEIFAPLPAGEEWSPLRELWLR